MATIPEHIEIRNLAGKPVAFLSPKADKLKNPWLDNQQNGPCTLTFELPTKSKKWAYLTDAYRIIAEGKEFVIHAPDAIEATREGRKTWGKVTAQESWVLLRKKFRTVSNSAAVPTPAWSQVAIVSGGAAAGGYSPGSAGSALTYLLEGSGWTVGIVDVPGTRDLENQKERLLANVQKVQELWGGIFVWDSLNHIVHLRDENTYQPYNGFQIRYAKNLKHISRVDDYDIVTRLYPFGADGLDIHTVAPGGNIYVEDFSYTSVAYEDTYINQELLTAQALYDKAQEVLAKICKPRHTYKARLVDLRTLPEYAHETFQVSDMADVPDDELGAVRIRIIRHKYNIFQPWQCEVDIGDPMVTLASIIYDSSVAAKYVDIVKPNAGIVNMLKGIVDTFVTLVNGAKGAFDLVDGVATWRELDVDGNQTGKMVRVSPGGLMVSTNGGVDWDTIMTATGLVAKAFFAIASSDGFTKLIDSGLVVYDNAPTPVKRVHLGQYQAGKFGLLLIDPTGSQTILDDNGILQSWQEGQAENVDATHPLTLNLYIPPETKVFKKAILRFKLAKYRAYETGAASGGGSTSGSSSASTSANGYENIEVTNYVFSSGPDVDYTRSEYADADTHDHGIATGVELAKAGGGSVMYYAFSGSSHVHWLPPHVHNYSAYGHSHGMAHTHQISNHTHAIDYGIYEGATATGVTIKINGIDRTAALGGGIGFTTDQANLNIAAYLTKGAWNTIELGSTSLGRIDATAFIQAMMGV
ncbi:MAG: phage tail protein [Carboxydocellales bacterium]